jgi:hypothetical protein
LASAGATFLTEDVGETERFRVAFHLTFAHWHIVEVVLGSHFHHILPHIVGQTPKFFHIQHNIVVQLIYLIVQHGHDRNTGEHGQGAEADGASGHDFTHLHHYFPFLAFK